MTVPFPKTVGGEKDQCMAWAVASLLVYTTSYSQHYLRAV